MMGRDPACDPTRERDRPPGSWTVEPTPTSLRREAREHEVQRLNRQALEARRPAGEREGTPQPATGQRDLTPKEQAQILEKSRAGLLVTAEEHRDHKRFGDDHTILDHVVPGWSRRPRP
jgi:hypothetical protein